MIIYPSAARDGEKTAPLLGDNIFDLIIQLSNMLKKHPEKNRAIALLQHEITR